MILLFNYTQWLGEGSSLAGCPWSHVALHRTHIMASFPTLLQEAEPVRAATSFISTDESLMLAVRARAQPCLSVRKILTSLLLDVLTHNPQGTVCDPGPCCAGHSSQAPLWVLCADDTGVGPGASLGGWWAGRLRWGGRALLYSCRALSASLGYCLCPA